MIEIRGNKFDADDSVVVIFNSRGDDLSDGVGEINFFRNKYPSVYENVLMENSFKNGDCTIFKGSGKKFAVLNCNPNDLTEYKNGLVALSLLGMFQQFKNISIDYPTNDTERKLKELEKLEDEYGVVFNLYENE